MAASTQNPLATIAPTKTLVLCELPLRLALWTAFAAVLRYALDQVEAEDPGEAVHEYRKSVRRARALLRLLRPSLERDTWRELDTILRDQVRRTSALRDADVLIDTLSALPDTLRADHAAAYTQAQQRLKAQAKPDDGSDPRELLASTRSALVLAVCQLGVEVPRGFNVEALDEGLRAAYRAAAKALDQAASSSDADDVHTLRKRVKELRYQLEALSAQHEDWRAEQERERFAKLAEALGEVTDLHVLTTAIESLDEPLTGQQALLEAVEAHTSALTEDVLERAAEALDHHARRWVMALREVSEASSAR